MAFLKFKNVGITAMSGCVPENIQYNSELSDLIPKDELENLVNTIGIKEKRVTNPDVCASDLCYYAANELLDSLDIPRDSIDVLIFMSQDGDYRIPATAPSLQHRLGLSKSTASFDINLSCSGYIYSLSTAFAYASQEGINRVLLLDGETFSKLISMKDKSNAPLYGDAGTASLIEKGNFGDSYFSLNSDGSGVNVLKIDAGGARNRSSLSNLEEVAVEDGNFRSPHQLYMDGMEVFNFAMMNVPKDIKNLLTYAGKELSDLDLIIFHQANKFMTDYFVKRLRYDTAKVPYSLDRFGNTSSASIPLTIITEIRDKIRKNIVLSGFGAGLSWGSAMMDLSQTTLLPLIEK
jgi:3-oxoacyl-[acyl-carrier-protein] synthase III